MAADLHASAEAALRAKRQEWEHRLAAIQADRRRVSAPLDRDFDDQAIQRENDATLDALDARGRQELDAVESALQRLADGTYGTCTRCGGPIEAARLRAEPAAPTCLECAENGSQG